MNHGIFNAFWSLGFRRPSSKIKKIILKNQGFDWICSLLLYCRVKLHTAQWTLDAANWMWTSPHATKWWHHWTHAFSWHAKRNVIVFTGVLWLYLFWHFSPIYHLVFFSLIGCSFGISFPLIYVIIRSVRVAAANLIRRLCQINIETNRHGKRWQQFDSPRTT